jgi:hypothetical protein
MSALSKIKQAGFDVFLYGDGFKISPSSKLSQNQRAFLKSHKAEIISELQAEALRIEALQIPERTPETLITCGDCLNFKCHNSHEGGSGVCNVGVQSSGSCWWSETEHQCTEFDAKVEWIELPEPKPDALMVTCYTPAGDAIEIEASSPEHAGFLMRMNPRREASDGLKPVKEFLGAAVDKIDAMYRQNIENGVSLNKRHQSPIGF